MSTVYVVFSGTSLVTYWSLATSKFWRHCLVLLPIYPDGPSLHHRTHSMIFEPRFFGLKLSHSQQNPRRFAKFLAAGDHVAVVSYQLPDKQIDRHVSRGLMTCVSLAKALLFVNKWYIITPHQLYRHLLVTGGADVTMELANDRTI